MEPYLKRPEGGYEVETLKGAPHLFTLQMRKPG